MQRSALLISIFSIIMCNYNCTASRIFTHKLTHFSNKLTNFGNFNVYSKKLIQTQHCSYSNNKFAKKLADLKTDHPNSLTEQARFLELHKSYIKNKNILPVLKKLGLLRTIQYSSKSFKLSQAYCNYDTKFKKASDLLTEEIKKLSPEQKLIFNYLSSKKNFEEKYRSQIFKVLRILTNFYRIDLKGKINNDQLKNITDNITSYEKELHIYLNHCDKNIIHLYEEKKLNCFYHKIIKNIESCYCLLEDYQQSLYFLKDIKDGLEEYHEGYFEYLKDIKDGLEEYHEGYFEYGKEIKVYEKIIKNIESCSCLLEDYQQSLYALEEMQYSFEEYDEIRSELLSIINEQPKIPDAIVDFLLLTALSGLFWKKATRLKKERPEKQLFQSKYPHAYFSSKVIVTNTSSKKYNVRFN
jgi:hypothetical protein